MGFLQQVRDLGNQADTAQNDRKHVRLTNLLAALVLSMSLGWAGFSALLGEHAAATVFGIRTTPPSSAPSPWKSATT